MRVSSIWNCLWLFAAFCGKSVADELRYPPSSPTVVYVHLLINALEQIDAAESTFYTDFYLSMAWIDNRLANDSGITYDPTSMFNPQVEFLNSREVEAADYAYTFGLPNYLANDASVTANISDTWISALTRVAGTFSADLKLQAFPQDYQQLTILIESFIWQSSQVEFRPVAGVGSRLLSNDIQFDGWSAETTGIETIHNFFPSINEMFSRCIPSIGIRRDPSYYMNRTVTNVILLVVMALLISSMRGDRPHRLSGTISVFMSIVSWVFVLVQETPKVSYLTRMDSFINVSFAMVFALAVFHAFAFIFYRYLREVEGEAIEAGTFNHDASKDDSLPTALERWWYGFDKQQLKTVATGGYTRRRRVSAGRKTDREAPSLLFTLLRCIGQRVTRERQMDTWYVVTVAVVYLAAVAAIFGRPVDVN